MEFLQHLQVQHWLILAVVLLVLEMILPGIFLMWIGLAAGGVALLLWILDIGWQAQWLSFAGLAVLSVAINLIWFRQRPLQTDRPLLNQRGQQYIGQSFELVEPIVNGSGKIKIGDTVWKVSGPDCPAGQSVRIIGMDGIVFQVEPTNQTKA